MIIIISYKIVVILTLHAHNEETMTYKTRGAGDEGGDLIIYQTQGFPTRGLRPKGSRVAVKQVARHKAGTFVFFQKISFSKNC